MVVSRKLGKGPLELLPGQIQSVVIDVFPSSLDSLKQQVHLSQIAVEISVRVCVFVCDDVEAGCLRTYPLPSSMIIDLSGIQFAILEAESFKTRISSFVR